VATKCNIYVLDGLDENGGDIVKVSFNKIKCKPRDKFDWHVFNLTRRSHTIVLSDFTYQGATSNPFTTNPPFVVNPYPLAAGDDSNNIKVTVATTVPNFGTYLYNIYVDGYIAVDPELDIEAVLHRGRKGRKKAAKKKAAKKANVRTRKK
jgi:hypothetical protein